MLKQAAILFTALIAFHASSLQAKEVPVVGFLLNGSERVQGIYVDQLRQGLSKVGYVDGHDIMLEYRFADGKSSIGREQAEELVRRGVDVIVTVGEPQTHYAVKATQTIPIVATFSGDLVQSGLISSMARPGGNVTGTTVLVRELYAKRLQLLIEAVPDISRVAMLLSPTKGALAAVAQTRLAAKNLGVTVLEVRVRAPADFAGAFAAMARQHVDAIIMVASPITSVHRRQLIELAGARKLPTICWRQEVVQVGCLMSYAPDRNDIINLAAGYVAKILRGAKPANLPVEQPASMEIALNLKTAKVLGITIPPSILLRATQVIE